MLTAGLIGLSLLGLQDPAPVVNEALKPRPARAFTFYATAGGARHNKTHSHIPIVAYCGYLNIADGNGGEKLFEYVYHRPWWDTDCKGVVHVDPIPTKLYVRSFLRLLRGEGNKIQTVEATFGQYMFKTGFFEGKTLLDNAPIRISYESPHKLMGTSRLTNSISEDDLKLHQAYSIPAFGTRSQAKFSLKENGANFVSFAEAILTDAGRLKGYADKAKKGEEVVIRFLSMDGTSAQQMLYWGKQAVDFGPVKGIYDRFELRTRAKLKTHRGTIWLDDRGALAMAMGVADRDMALPAFGSQFFVPIDRRNLQEVYPARMDFGALFTPIR